MSDAVVPTIVLRGISKVYPLADIETRALWNIDLTINPNDYLSIVGPSGSGKSTLLALLGLLDFPSRGSYLLEGVEVGTLSLAKRARVRNAKMAFVFQSFNLIGDLTVLENVELPLVYRNTAVRERRASAMECIERAGLSHRANRYPSQLSGGEQQRVAIARALVGRPSILLADEPTGNLDSRDGNKIMELFSELHDAGSTLCLVTHNDLFASYASKQIAMLDGTIRSSQR